MKSLENKVVMIVEDDSELRAVLEKKFTAVGMIPYSTSSGEDALKCYGRHKSMIDAILMDIGLPGKLDGLQTRDRLVQDGGCVTPVVFMSGRNPPSGEALGLSETTQFLAKPFNFSDMSDALKHMLREPTVA